MSKYIFILFLTFAFSCTNTNEEEFFICDDIDNISWKNNDVNKSIEIIFENKCSGCHSVGGSAENFIISYNMLTIYGQVLADFINGVAEGFSYQIMPPLGTNPLTDCEKEKILNWINNDFLFDENNR